MLIYIRKCYKFNDIKIKEKLIFSDWKSIDRFELVFLFINVMLFRCYKIQLLHFDAIIKVVFFFYSDWWWAVLMMSSSSSSSAAAAAANISVDLCLLCLLISHTYTSETTTTTRQITKQKRKATNMLNKELSTIGFNVISESIGKNHWCEIGKISRSFFSSSSLMQRDRKLNNDFVCV